MSSGRPPLLQAQEPTSQPSRRSHRRLSAGSDPADILPGEELPEDTEDMRVKFSQEVEGGSVEGRESAESDSDVLWVDWDGPEDPMNPKKYVLIIFDQQNHSIFFVP